MRAERLAADLDRRAVAAADGIAKLPERGWPTLIR